MILPMTIIQFSIRRLVLTIIIICLAGKVQSQDSGGIDFFNSDEILNISINTDFKNLIKRKRDRKYQKAELIVKNKPYSIRLKARGNYRLENCSFPPIMLNFSKTKFDEYSNNQLKKLKLVLLPQTSVAVNTT